MHADVLGSRQHGEHVAGVSAASSAPWPKARWLRSTIALAPAGNRRSRWRPRHGWCRWRARRRRTLAIPTSCGRPDFSPATLARMDRRRACMPGQSGAGHRVQDPGPGSGEAAQSAILPGTARSRLCGKDGRGVVRLSPGENPQAGGGRVEEQKAERRGGDHLLRREAGYPGDRDNGPGFAARTGRPCDLRT